MIDAQFGELWRALRAQGSAEEAFALLERAYSEPPRAYHTLEHVRWGLRRIDEIVRREELEDRVEVNALRWAMWFHDSVMTFGPGSEEDEERSARAAYRAAKNAKLPTGFADLVMRLVLSTSHLADNLKRDEAVLVDADLSMLGAGEADFDVYEDRVRREWAHADDRAFAHGRTAVLRRFLAKRRIFTTDFARERWEVRARSNLNRSIGQLSRML